MIEPFIRPVAGFIDILFYIAGAKPTVPRSLTTEEKIEQHVEHVTQQFGLDEQTTDDMRGLLEHQRRMLERKQLGDPFGRD